MTPNHKSRIENQKFPLALAAALLAFHLWLPTSARAADDSPPEQIPLQVQSAVDRGLQWLASKQDPASGAFPSASGADASAAITSLAAMAFMARGHVPGQGPYGDHLNHAVDYLLHIQRPNGLFTATDMGEPMYDHGISTVMLCEAYGMLDERRQAAAAAAIAKAVRVILLAQAVHKDPDSQGGWRYQPTAPDSDLSVTGWQLMALRGAANIGAPLPPQAIQMGIAYIKRRAVRGGGFSYNGNSDPSPPRAGTGILALELLGQHNAPESLAAGDYLRRHPVSFRATYYFYGVYYCAQAAWQLGGDYWTDINAPIRDSLLQRQNQDGSWTVPGGRGEAAGGDAYATSMSILALTVPYRYLPIYQR